MDWKIDVAGIAVPRFLYGTAWKEEQTQPLTEAALSAGFRGIDTANQRKHYDEASVGRGIAAAIAAGVVARDELFMQTKFTFRRGQDHRLPYNPAAPIATQVEQSFERSLEHLQLDRIDSYVLHGPSSSEGITADDLNAWRAMESLFKGGRTKLLGVSNVSLRQLELLCSKVEVAPHFVQNRCFAITGWDRAIRHFCESRGIIYQAFSLLTANRPFLSDPQVVEIAQRHQWTPAQVVFRFAIQAGMIALTGTSDETHMRLDLRVIEEPLTPDELEIINQIAHPS